MRHRRVFMKPAGQAAVITVSDRSFKGDRADTSGPLLAELLTDLGFEVGAIAIVPDEVEASPRSSGPRLRPA